MSEELGACRSVGVAGMVIAAIVIAAMGSAAFVVLPAAAEDEGMRGACVLQSIELEERDQETLLHIRTDGDPAAIGARVEPGEGVVLDLGCTPSPDLAGSEFAEGLVSALRLNHDSAVQSASTPLVIQIRGAFEYSVSSQPGIVLVRLRAEEATGMPAGEPGEKIRVLEPLPIAVVPQMPLPEQSPPELLAAASESPTPEMPGAADMVEAWARAWSEQRIEDYLSAYASGYQPPTGLSRSAWETQRRIRLARPRWIEVVLENLDERAIGAGRAVVAFRQNYSSDTFSDQVEKALTLILEDGRWQILREEVVDPNEQIGGLPFAQTQMPEAPEGPTVEGGEPSAELSETAAAIIEGARVSVRNAPSYDASYQFIPYPGGDPGLERGSGADVVVRAYRHFGVDLQERIHEDVLIASDYDIETPDTHIDHRRIRNLRIFLRRHGSELEIDHTADWRPGDIVFWAVEGHRDPDHLGIVSDRRNPDGQFLVLHHGEGGPPREEDVLFAWAVRGHYRWLPAADL